jgi:DNA-binding NarL/FixJ family response regulator
MGTKLERIQVLIAADYGVFRQAVRNVLERETDVRVVAEAGFGRDAVIGGERTRPNVALLCFSTSDDGFAVTAAMRERVPSCRVIVLTDEPDDVALRRAIEAGAAGYLTKASGMAELIEAIRSVHRGDTLVPPRMLGPLFEGLISHRRGQRDALRQLSLLSPREQEVLRLLVDGAGNDEIGRSLAISPQTARTHIQRVIRKLGVHSRLEAVMLATQSGFVADLPELRRVPPASAALDTPSSR